MYRCYPKNQRFKIVYLKVFGYKAYLLTNNVFTKRVRTNLKIGAQAYIR